MDLIDERMTAYSHDKDFSPSIRAAVHLAKKTLNRYYQLTDSSEVYRIAMGMSFCLPYPYEQLSNHCFFQSYTHVTN